MVEEKGSLIRLHPDHPQVTTPDHDSQGKWGSIMKVEVPEGVEWVLKNGAFIYQKLYDGQSGTEVPGTATTILGFEAPGDTQISHLSDELSYLPYSNLTPKEQRNAKYKSDELRLYIDEAEVSFVEDTPFYILGKCSSSDIYLDDGSGDSPDTCNFNVYEYEL